MVKTSGQNLDYHGFYLNYWVANGIVLVPNYNDPNDAVANEVIQTLHPNHIPLYIDGRNLCENGGHGPPAHPAAVGLKSFKA